MSEVATALKDKNRMQLGAVIVLNLVVFYGLVQAPAIFRGELQELVSGVEKVVPAVVCLALVVVLNGLVSPTTKARLIFLQWANPLPGSQAFTRYGPSDPRVGMERLETTYGPLPTDAVAQNKLWYSLYRLVRTDPSVAKAHQDFLFARDYAVIALLLLLGLGPIALWQLGFSNPALYYNGILLLQLVLVTRAARVYSIGFVTNVLAVASTETSARTNG